MTDPLKWRDATAGDRALLEQFTCTIDAPRGPRGRPLPHPRPWERSVQSAIRERRSLTYAGGRLLLGLALPDTLMAVVAHSPLAAPSDMPEPSRLLGVVAVSTAARGAGGAVADEALEQGLSDMTGLPEFSRTGHILVLCGIDERNTPSEKLVRRHGFECVGPADDRSLRPWALLLER